MFHRRRHSEIETPFYDRYYGVLKDRRKNVALRRLLWSKGRESRKNADAIWLMCAKDHLFYLNAFVMTFDPRLTKTPTVPFITYEYQDDVIERLILAVMKGEDVLIEKSRDMGASWMCAFVYHYLTQFRDMMSFLMVSRKEDLVDKTGDPKCLFWKIDFMLKHLPWWLKPEYNRNKLHLHNETNGSTIDGESTTGDVARGDRRTSIMLDEFAYVDNGAAVLKATRDATKSRIFNSTPNGQGNAFYELTKTKIEKITLHWSIHPEKRKGLYCSKKGELEILDKEYRFPADYEFILDGKVRSPWYDRECERAAHPIEIAQELDIDYAGSDALFFDDEIINAMVAKWARDPIKKGFLRYDFDNCQPQEFEDNSRSGNLSLWINLDARGLPPRDRNYVIGCDIGRGTGASNSVLCIGDTKTKEQVGELVTNAIDEAEFGRLAAAVARFFLGVDGQPAYMLWEANGPGQTFGRRVMEAGVWNFYYHDDEKSIKKANTKRPGWWSSKQTKRVLMDELKDADKNGFFITRSLEAMKERRQYALLANGSVTYIGSKASENPEDSDENHGDRVVSCGLCRKGLKMRETPEMEIEENYEATFAGRKRARREEELMAAAW